MEGIEPKHLRMERKSEGPRQEDGVLETNHSKGGKCFVASSGYMCVIDSLKGMGPYFSLPNIRNKANGLLILNINI